MVLLPVIGTLSFQILKRLLPVPRLLLLAQLALGRLLLGCQLDAVRHLPAAGQ